MVLIVLSSGRGELTFQTRATKNFRAVPIFNSLQYDNRFTKEALNAAGFNRSPNLAAVCSPSSCCEVSGHTTVLRLQVSNVTLMGSIGCYRMVRQNDLLNLRKMRVWRRKGKRTPRGWFSTGFRGRAGADCERALCGPRASLREKSRRSDQLTQAYPCDGPLEAHRKPLRQRRQPFQQQPQHGALPELAGQRAITWKYYVTSGTAPDSGDGAVVGQHSSEPQAPHTYTLWNPLPAFPAVVNNPTQWSQLVDSSEFYTDAANGNLPQVSWVVPSDAVSEHPPSSMLDGMSYVTGLINAVMQSPEWSSTAIFLAWDDWGGIYDHVPPPVVDEFGYGLRVPGMIISPYSRQGFIDHQTYSFDSWLRMIELRFGTMPLTARDTEAADMMDAFDFNQSPRPPMVLPTTEPYPSWPPTRQQQVYPSPVLASVANGTGGYSLRLA